MKMIICQGRKQVINRIYTVQCKEYICYDCASKQSKNKKILCDSCTESMNKLFSNMNEQNLTFYEKANILQKIRLLYGFEVGCNI